MGEVPAGGNPSQQEPARAIGNSHQERLEANLGGDSAVPGWAGVGQAKAWNARATRLARRLESRGVSAEQLSVLLDVVLPTGWDSEAGITLSDEESGWHLRELVSIGSAAAASLRMRRVTQANASVPRCKNRCHRAANVPYDTCCQACSRPRHTHQWRDNDFLEARRAALAWEEPGQNQGHAPAGSSGLGARMSAWCFNLALRWTCVLRFVLHVVDNDESYDRTAQAREK